MSRVNEIKKMLKTDPTDSFLTYALALEYEKAGDTKQAVQIIEQLMQTDEEYLGAYYKLGQLVESQGNIAKAIEIYTKGIDLAGTKQDFKTKGELEEALWLIEDETN